MFRPVRIPIAKCCDDAVMAEQISPLASVFTAELNAIHLALKHIQMKGHHSSLICSNSLSALQTLISYDSSPHPILLQTKTLLVLLSKRRYTIKFCWVPGHVGIQGNELADAAAKSASPNHSHLSFVTFSDFKPVINQKLRKM